MPRATCHRIVTGKLKMAKKLRKWIPYQLTPKQVEARVEASRANLQLYQQQESRLEHTVAIDETWVSLYRPPERDQAREWCRPGEASSSVVLPTRFGRKVMLIVALDIHGICYYEILAEKGTVTARRYLEFLQNLVNKRRGKRKHTMWLLDDNAKPHRHALVTAWIAENNIRHWHQPAYSPDLSPCDYGCFHVLKRAIGNQSYPTIDALRLSNMKFCRVTPTMHIRPFNGSQNDGVNVYIIKDNFCNSY